MIKIKGYIFNENDIKVIENDEDLLTIIFKDGSYRETQGTFDDIEWNYVDKVHNDKLEKAYKRVHDELVYITGLQRDCLKTRLEQSHKIQELEEENKKLKEENERLKGTTKYTYDITI
jgi:hypothetical protein